MQLPFHRAAEARAGGARGAVRLDGPALRVLCPQEGDAHGWQLLELRGWEAINHGFDYAVVLQHGHPWGPADPASRARAMLGRELRIRLPAGPRAGAPASSESSESRHIAGIVTELEQTTPERSNHDAPAHDPRARPSAGPMLRLRLRPWTCLAEMQAASRVHQERSLVDVLRELLGRYEHAWELRLQGSYPRLDYLVQFDETDGEFLRRQCARWGLHLHFEHGPDGHCLVVGDGVHALHAPLAQAGEVLELRSHPRPDEPGVLHALCTEASQGVAAWMSGAQPECHPGSRREWRDDSRLEPESADALIRWHGADGVCRPRRAIEQPPEREDDALAESRLNRRHAGQARRGLERVLGNGTLAGLAAGHRVRLRRASVRDGEWQYVQRTSLLWQTHGAADPAGEADAPRVSLQFEARPVDDQPCPMPAQACRRSLGVQTGTVLPAAYDEASFTDPVGRLRVRLHWAHADAGASTCWIRLLRPAAGEAMGCATWPRPGQDVLVDFLDGDPDTPVCVGLLRDPAHVPQWPLPDTAEISGWFTRTLREGEQDPPEAAGSQLLLDDREGALHAQLACDSAASALRLGCHSPVSCRDGRGDTRGEGFELRSDAAVAVRAARALMLLAAAASRAARDIVQPLRACRRQLHAWLEEHAGSRPVRDAHGPLPEGPAAPLRADLQAGANPLLLHAQGGLSMASARAGQLAAGAHCACSAEHELLAVCRGPMLLHAEGSAMLAGTRQGLQLAVSDGALSLLAPNSALRVHARGLLRMGSARQAVRLQGAGCLQLQAAGQRLELGPEGIRHAGSSWNLRAAGRRWGAPMPRGGPR